MSTCDHVYVDDGVVLPHRPPWAKDFQTRDLDDYCFTADLGADFRFRYRTDGHSAKAGEPLLTDHTGWVVFYDAGPRNSIDHGEWYEVAIQYVDGEPRRLRTSWSRERDGNREVFAEYDGPIGFVFDRAAMVRVVVAQQWATAITICGDSLRETHDPECPSLSADARDRIEEFAALPCAVDVVADLLGEVR